MCRLLAYLGSEISLNELIINPEHSLEKQAWQPRELREAKLNADGFGIGWYHNRQPRRYRQPIPIWNDPNLHDLSQSMISDLWFAMVRSATPGLGTHQDNTQPFRYQQWLFMHNGYILDFAKTARGQLRHLLGHEFEQNIQGNTDSEYLFALILHYMQNSSVTQAIQQAFHTLAEILGEHRALLNIMLTDGQTIYATSHAINGLCPTLYYARDIKQFGNHNQLLASEALTVDDNWQAVGDNQLIIMTAGKPLHMQAL